MSAGETDGQTRIGELWIKIGVIYFIIGVGIGIFMGATQSFALRSVHAHVNLLGWATVALAGIIYTLFPRAAASKLAVVHFWLHNTGLPLGMGSLALVLSGYPALHPVLLVSQLLFFQSVPRGGDLNLLKSVIHDWDDERSVAM